MSTHKFIDKICVAAVILSVIITILFMNRSAMGIQTAARTIGYMLTRQDDVILIKAKDYIANPKPNGDRNLHLIVKVPIFLSNEKQVIPVEIQMCMIATGFWACLAH